MELKLVGGFSFHGIIIRYIILNQTKNILMGKDIPYKSHSKMKDKIKSLALKRHKSAKKITQKHKSILLDP